MSHEFHIHVGCTVSFVIKPCLINLSEISIQKWGPGGHDGAQLRPQSLTYTQSCLCIEEVTFNKTSMNHDCHVIWHFSPKRPFSLRLINVIAFPCSSLIHVCPHLMFSILYFKSSWSTISIKKVNAMPLCDFCASDFEVAILKMIIRTSLFIAMTTSPG